MRLIKPFRAEPGERDLPWSQPGRIVRTEELRGANHQCDIHIRFVVQHFRHGCRGVARNRALVDQQVDALARLAVVPGARPVRDTQRGLLIRNRNRVDQLHRRDHQPVLVRNRATLTLRPFAQRIVGPMPVGRLSGQRALVRPPHRENQWPSRFGIISMPL